VNLKGSKTEKNLKDAFAGESQANRRYLYFAAKADVEGFNDVSTVFRSTAEGETVFNSLSEGGNVIMPFQPVFWAKRSGMLTDRFGTSWNINGEVTI